MRSKKVNMLDKNKKTVEAYNKNAQFYADKFDSYGIRIDDIDRALKLNDSGCDKVLELGCAGGRDAQYIVSKVGKENYLGIDASSELIKIAREKNPDVMFQVKEMRDVSLAGQAYETETYGVIFSFASVLHVNREELVELIEKCHKSLKIRGILYISTKYGEYKELEIENLGDKKYYYSYTPEDIKIITGNGFLTVYSVIQDSNYGPELVMALRKTA